MKADEILLIIERLLNKLSLVFFFLALLFLFLFLLYLFDLHCFFGGFGHGYAVVFDSGLDFFFYAGGFEVCHYPVLVCLYCVDEAPVVHLLLGSERVHCGLAYFEAAVYYQLVVSCFSYLVLLEASLAFLGLDWLLFGVALQGHH